MRLSVSSYSFQQYLKQGKLKLCETIDKAAEMGFEGIEFIDLPKDLPQAERLLLAAQLRARAADRGLAIVAYTVGANLWQPDAAARLAEAERLKGEVDIAVALGAPVMRHDLVSKLDATGTGRSFLGMMPHLVPIVREIADYAAERGVKTCSENHGRVAQDSTRIEAFIAMVDHDNYGALVDIGNFLCVDEDPLLAVSRVANFAVHAHAKDMLVCPMETDPALARLSTRARNRLKPTVIGKGSVPVKQCIATLQAAGYDGWLSLEYEADEDCMCGIREGLATLRQYLAELS